MLGIRYQRRCPDKCKRMHPPLLFSHSTSPQPNLKSVPSSFNFIFGKSQSYFCLTREYYLYILHVVLLNLTPSWNVIWIFSYFPGTLNLLCIWGISIDNFLQEDDKYSSTKIEQLLIRKLEF